MEWKPKLVELKDDIPRKSAAFERLVHESQLSETVNDDTKTGVTVLGMEDMRVKAHLPEQREDRELDTDARGPSRSREHNSTLTANLCQCRPVCIRRAKARAKTRMAKARARMQRTSRPRK